MATALQRPFKAFSQFKKVPEILEMQPFLRKAARTPALYPTPTVKML
jgi:hypothetical protein